jgi:hypothetical protein
MDLLDERGAEVAYHDPHVPVIQPSREHAHWAGLRSVGWDRQTIESGDQTGSRALGKVVLISPVVSHSAIVGLQGLPLRREVSSQQLSISTAYIPIDPDATAFAQLPGCFNQGSIGSGLPGQFVGRRRRGSPIPEDALGTARPTAELSANSRQRGLP